MRSISSSVSRISSRAISRCRLASRSYPQLAHIRELRKYWLTAVSSKVRCWLSSSRMRGSPCKGPSRGSVPDRTRVVSSTDPRLANELLGDLELALHPGMDGADELQRRPRRGRDPGPGHRMLGVDQQGVAGLVQAGRAHVDHVVEGRLLVVARVVRLEERAAGRAGEDLLDGAGHVG